MNGCVFIDASFWIAYRDEREERHRDASRILAEVFRKRLRLITTIPVLCEIQAHFSRSPKKRRMVIKDFSDNPVVVMEAATPHDQQTAFEMLLRHGDKSYSLCDALSFVVMQRLQIGRALAFDDHFRQVGGFDILS